MNTPKVDYHHLPALESAVVREEHIETGFIGKLQCFKYEYRRDITDRATLEQNFREKFEALNRVRLTNGEFDRLLDEIVTSNVFAAAKTLRQKTLLCFFQLFIVSNRDSTYDAANKNARHIAFNADDLVNNARLSAGEIELSLVA